MIIKFKKFESKEKGDLKKLSNHFIKLFSELGFERMIK